MAATPLSHCEATAASASAMDASTRVPCSPPGDDEDDDDAVNVSDARATPFLSGNSNAATPVRQGLRFHQPFLQRLEYESDDHHIN